MSRSNVTEPGRMRRERRTIRLMIEMYCRAHHSADATLCAECSALAQYAMARLDHCRFAPEKPTCAACPVHCYKPTMREAVRAVMRYAGPRMLLKHPLLALRHQFDEWWARRKQRADRSSQETPCHAEAKDRTD